MDATAMFFTCALLHHPRHCEERSDEAIQSFCGSGCFAALAMTDGNTTSPHRSKSHMPDFVRHLVEGRMPVDLGFRRLEHHALPVRVGGRDRARRHHPDREALAAAGVDVARGPQRHGSVARMQRTAMLLGGTVAAAKENFPPRGVWRGRADLSPSA